MCDYINVKLSEFVISTYFLENYVEGNQGDIVQIFSLCVNLVFFRIGSKKDSPK